ncbi:MAG: hypothetical protein K2X66_08820 [Cyanobacteria bacterium]|nr:hypothetical protein [Cyanobacteriota bacterium]
MNQPLRVKNWGSSVVEYALPIAIIVVAGGLFLLVSDFNSSLQHKLSGGQKAKVENQKLQIQHEGHLKLQEIPQEHYEAYMRGNGITFMKDDILCISGQNCLVVPSVQAGAVSEVDGGLGGSTVKKLAQSLSDLANQLKASGFDSNVVNLVRKLANKGHEEGDILLQANQFKNGVPCDSDLCNALGAPTPGTPTTLRDSAGSAGREFISAKSELDAFIAAHPDALPPQAIQLINGASSNIWEASRFVGSQYTINGQLDKTLSYVGSSANGVQMFNDGHFVTMNANVICHAGDAGKTCLR